MFKGFEDLAAFHESNFDAALRGSGVVSRGVDDLQAAVVSLVKGAGHTALSAAMAVPCCADARDLVRLQSDMAKRLFQTCVGQSLRIVEVQHQTARGALNHVEDRFLAGVEVLARARAA